MFLIFYQMEFSNTSEKASWLVRHSLWSLIRWKVLDYVKTLTNKMKVYSHLKTYLARERVIQIKFYSVKIDEIIESISQIVERFQNCRCLNECAARQVRRCSRSARQKSGCQITRNLRPRDGCSSQRILADINSTHQVISQSIGYQLAKNESVAHRLIFQPRWPGGLRSPKQEQKVSNLGRPWKIVYSISMMNTLFATLYQPNRGLDDENSYHQVFLCD